MSPKVAPKQRALELVRNLEEDATYEEILYRLYVLQQIEEGLDDAEQGRTISHEELGEQIDEWLK